ncbi:DNA-binding transcriptional activator of the SARP family [Anaerovirgula multivorans]|uniref:DNA-binding transcriptional activator of the SARP family n=1 Tax=Anaerovirgula multivorans TaxID=312168 RepID=A0A239G887_9FIRM|nr:BTAD domain-containing putative transcriptional regulator [Anaerovirgula multivorans]SNS64922.1 DNA-binding transcriptional activator of the SARP family [Anaerovirgula multivorans]
MLKFFFLGEPRILVKDKDISNRISSKAVGILAYLSAHCGEKVSRDRIASMFWNESSRKSSKYNLRYTLWSIKKELKEEGVEEEIILSPDKETCYFVEGGFWQSDVRLLEEAVNKINEKGATLQQYQEILELYGGEFLQHISLRGNPELDDWIIYERERVQKLYFDGLILLSRQFSNMGQYSKGVNCLQKLLYINPLQEELHHQLMELYLLNGDRIQAIQQYERCAEILRTELNISPMEKMTEFYYRIKNGQERGTPLKQDEGFHKNINYFVLGEIVEGVLDTYPQLVKQLPEDILWELAKLVPGIERSINRLPLTYHSQDIEKLRIFKAATFLLREAELQGAIPTIKVVGTVDKVSLQFLAYIAAKFPHITIPVETI